MHILSIYEMKKLPFKSASQKGNSVSSFISYMKCNLSRFLLLRYLLIDRRSVKGKPESRSSTVRGDKGIFFGKVRRRVASRLLFFIGSVSSKPCCCCASSSGFGLDYRSMKLPCRACLSLGFSSSGSCSQPVFSSKAFVPL